MAVTNRAKAVQKGKKKKQAAKVGWGRRALHFFFGDSATGEIDRGAQNVPMLADYIPYRSFDKKDQLFINRNSFGFVLDVAPMIGADESSAELLSQLFSDGIPAGANVQMIYAQTARIGSIIADWLRPRYMAGGVFYRAANHRSRHLRNGAFASLSKDAPFFLRSHRLTISVSAEMGGEVSREAMVSTRDSMIATLGSIGIPCRILTPVEVISIVEDTILQNRDTNDSPDNYNELDSIGNQCVRRDIVTRISEHRLVVRGPKNRSVGTEDDGTPIVEEVSPTDFDMRFFSVRNFPKVFAPWDVQKLIGDMFNDKLRYNSNIIVSLNLRYFNDEDASAQAGYKRLRTGGLADSKSARWLRNINEQHAEWVKADEDLRQGKKLCQAYYCVGSIAPYGKGDIAERSLKAVYKHAGWDLSDETYLQVHGLLSMLPCTLADGLGDDLHRMRRFRKFTSNIIANIAPLQGEYIGGKIPHLLLAGRRGQPFFWSPFQNSSGNHNTVVFGKSGSGKSVLLQDLCNAMVGAGGKVTVIDDGRSFEHMCHALDGDFVEFKLSAGFCLNPFSMIDGDAAGDDEDYEVDCLSMLKSMVGQMVRQNDRLTDTERGIIDAVVNKVWEEKRTDGCVDDVADALRSDGSPYAGDLADAIRPFCSKGTYGAFFKGQCSLNMDANFTVFELSDLSSREELRSVVLTAIMFLSQQVMRRMDRAIPKMMLIDEAWQMLKGGAMAEFIDTYARTCRKYGSSLTTATQSFNDFYKSEGSLAALENSDWSVCLAQKEESITELVKHERFVTDAYMEAVVRSMKTHGTEYSEVTISGPDSKACGRLVLDPYSATLYSSSPHVFQSIEELVAEGYAMADAIEMVAFPQAFSARDEETQFLVAAE